MSGPLLVVENLKTWLDAGKSRVRAVDGISFAINPHETFALLGESGCGKSMTALSIMRLLPEAGRIVSGSVLLDGQDLLGLPEIAMRTVRGKRIAMIFQEPMTSLNPVVTIGNQIAETLYRHTVLRGDAARARVLELLDAVGIPDARARYNDYPFQFSGGMKQRVMIAIALACEPDLLIADEPTTALDVTIQAQVLELLRRLQRDHGMAVLLITHDLGVVSEMAQRVAVMYAGEIVEMADRDTFFANPQHPYTRKLFASLPGAVRRGQRLEIIRGAVPPLDHDFSGCRFASRCDFAWQKCSDEIPAWSEVASGHQVRCHLMESSERAVRESVMTLPSPAVRREERAELPLLKVDDLKVHFPIRKGLFKRVAGHVRAVDGVSLAISPGRTLALASGHCRGGGWRASRGGSTGSR